MKEKLKNNKIYNFIRENQWRVLICACLISGVFVMPLLTESRYLAYLNGFTAVIAKEYYFSSNYLKEGGADYSMSWDGAQLGLNEIRIQNYENTLLANQTGQDLKYTLSWTVESFNTENKNVTDSYQYRLGILETEGDSNGQVSELAETSDTQLIIGDGSAKDVKYNFVLIPPTGTAMPTGYYTVVTFTATNSDGNANQYNKTISAKMRYNVSIMDDFIRSIDVAESDESEEFSVKLSTEAKDSSGTSQRVYLWWDLNKIEVNRFNAQFNRLYMAKKYSEQSANGRTFGLLEISATSLSSYVFEFKKLDEDITITKNVAEKVSYADSKATDYMGYYLVKEGGTQ